MVTHFVIHRHHTGRTHFDLRLRDGEKYRSWSLLREPPTGAEGRLAIERECQQPEALDAARVTEQAFGSGKVRVWDAGEVDLRWEADDRLVLEFRGQKMRGSYLLSRTRWYPGNRWILRRGSKAVAGKEASQQGSSKILTGNLNPLEPTRRNVEEMPSRSPRVEVRKTHNSPGQNRQESEPAASPHGRPSEE